MFPVLISESAENEPKTIADEGDKSVHEEINHNNVEAKPWCYWFLRRERYKDAGDIDIALEQVLARGSFRSTLEMESLLAG